MEIKFSNYGQDREINATDEEVKIFEAIKSTTGRDDLRLVRKSDNYVTAALGDWNLARIKYTSRAKWISFPTVEAGATKHKITHPGEAVSFAELIADSLAHIDKYSVE